MRTIKLTRNKVAIVCDCHYDLVINKKWSFQNIGYAYRQYRIKGKQTPEMMHRVIADTPKHLEVDHIDGDKLNNQCTNLENVTHKENMRRWLVKKPSTAKSGIKGVHWYSRRSKWVARPDGNYLGSFTTKEEAAQAVRVENETVK